MEFVVDPCIRNADELLELAKCWFLEFRANPFWTLEIQLGRQTEITVFDGDVMSCSLNKKAEEARTHDYEDGEGNISLILPQLHHWESEFSDNKPSQWIRMAFNRFCGQGDISEIQRFWHGKFHLSEVAEFLNRSVEDVAQDILKADANRLDTGRQILALSVDKYGDDPAWWVVDIRGFLLGSLYTDEPPEIYGGLIPRKVARSL